MDPSPSQRAVTLALVLGLLVVSMVPVFSAQSANALCQDPDEDGDVSTSSSATERAYDDFVTYIDEEKNVRLTPSSGDAQTLPKRGVHFIGGSPGTLDFDVVVQNQGHGTPDRAASQVRVRVTVEQPSGQDLVRNVDLDVPQNGASRSASVSIALAETGRHIIRLHVNPDQEPKEECRDEHPNPDCNFTPCTYPYDENNQAAYGLLLAALPDLVVDQVSTTGPARATKAPSSDARVQIEAVVRNDGPVAAFDLRSLDPAAGPFDATLAVTGCDCSATVSVPWVAPGATRTIRAELPVHGLTDSLEAVVDLDVERRVAESDEDDNLHKEVFPLATADLSASIATDLPMLDGRAILAQGQNATFTVTVHNLGDARAAHTDGGPFTVVVTRETDDKQVFSRQMTLDKLASVPLAVEDTDTLAPQDHDYLVRVDPADVVLESSGSNNQARLRVTVAEYKADLTIKESDARSTIPPGVTGQVPFEVQNAGTVPDTFRFSVASFERDDVHFVDASGNEVDEVTLKEKATFKGNLRYEVPTTAEKGETYTTTFYVRSAGSGTVVERGITFTIGADTVPPTLSLEDPVSGFLSSNRVLVRVIDNVAIQTVETDLSGSWQPVLPVSADSSLYVIDVSGLPNRFELNLQATDEADNQAKASFDLRRDLNAPRITDITFIPDQGVQPGDKVTVLVTVEDDNLETVTAEILQGRGGGNVYRENQTFRPHATTHQLRDWVVPERPGHYVFNVTATDAAGNTAEKKARLTVQGLDLRAPPTFLRPIVSRPNPVEGERITMTWLVQNTNPSFATGEFFVVLILDDERQIGIHTLDLAPGETRPVSFTWVATPGPHVFTMVIDQAEEVAEDDEQIRSNVVQHTTDSIFPEHPLFKPQSETTGVGGWAGRIVEYWYFPVLVVATAVLFAVAIALGRRTGAP